VPSDSLSTLLQQAAVPSDSLTTLLQQAAGPSDSVLPHCYNSLQDLVTHPYHTIATKLKSMQLDLNFNKPPSSQVWKVSEYCKIGCSAQVMCYVVSNYQLMLNDKSGMK
jgi:hypothetical protein